MITIIDYGMGNLRSVAKAIEKVGGQARIVSDPDQVASAEKLILPGVGAFCDAMGQLRTCALVEPIHDFVASGRPFLGICLGLQMLFETSFEDGEHAGLGIFPGKVVRFKKEPSLKIPHMGWNTLQIDKPAPILRDLPADPSVYFVHSYFVVPDDPEIVATRTEHGESFVSMVWKDNVFATQFHPEKSQKVGLKMLESFVGL